MLLLQEQGGALGSALSLVVAPFAWWEQRGDGEAAVIGGPPIGLDEGAMRIWFMEDAQAALVEGRRPWGRLPLGLADDAEIAALRATALASALEAEVRGSTRDNPVVRSSSSWRDLEREGETAAAVQVLRERGVWEDLTAIAIDRACDWLVHGVRRAASLRWGWRPGMWEPVSEAQWAVFVNANPELRDRLVARGDWERVDAMVRSARVQGRR